MWAGSSIFSIELLSNIGHYPGTIYLSHSSIYTLFSILNLSLISSLGIIGMVLMLTGLRIGRTRFMVMKDVQIKIHYSKQWRSIKYLLKLITITFNIIAASFTFSSITRLCSLRPCLIYILMAFHSYIQNIITFHWIFWPVFL